mmetsp:Transcript_48647/g.97458  ORF Transcript_48647/g.97458 Transcript_48647/m.97458 type:complete len:232 (-) Transcript_48647:42-737(-)
MLAADALGEALHGHALVPSTSLAPHTQLGLEHSPRPPPLFAQPFSILGTGRTAPAPNLAARSDHDFQLSLGSRCEKLLASTGKKVMRGSPSRSHEQNLCPRPSLDIPSGDQSHKPRETVQGASSRFRPRLHMVDGDPFCAHQGNVQSPEGRFLSTRKTVRNHPCRQAALMEEDGSHQEDQEGVFQDQEGVGQCRGGLDGGVGGHHANPFQPLPCYYRGRGANGQCAALLRR